VKKLTGIFLALAAVAAAVVGGLWLLKTLNPKRAPTTPTATPTVNTESSKRGLGERVAQYGIDKAGDIVSDLLN
jgi:hypothetical protein